MGKAQQIRHVPHEQRFETADGAFLTYTLREGVATFDHTVTPVHLRGQGIAAQLARVALDYARQQGWRVIPACSYIDAFIRRHPSYADLVDED